MTDTLLRSLTPPPSIADLFNAEPGRLATLSRNVAGLHFDLSKLGGDAGILSAPLVGSGLIAQQYRLREYVDLVFTMGIAFAIAFQTPIVVMLLSWAGIVDPKVLAKYRKHIILGCVVAAAVLTPTGDPVTLALMTAPLYLLFESGLFLAKFVPAKRVARGVFKKESWTDANEGDE